MKLRKIRTTIALLLAASMMFAACSKSAETEATESATETTVTEVEETSEASEETEETSEETTEETEAPTPTNSPTPTPFPLDPDTPEIEGWNLVWADEFNGDALNEDLWNREEMPAGWVNQELQRYTSDPSNAYVEDGSLVIQAYQIVDEDGNVTYTSGRVNTKGNADITYGRVEVRARVPQGQGLWPAIWMLPRATYPYGDWPRSGEIDIMEMVCHDTTTTYGNLHYGNPHEDQQGIYTLPNGESFADDYHVYALEWEPSEMRYYIDGELFHTINTWYSSPNGNILRDFPAPFDKPFYVILNLAVGGTWPGDPDETTNFDEAKFYVDYVRVYQLDSYDTNVTRPDEG